MTWRVIALLLLAACGGCGRSSPVPSETYYRLAPVTGGESAPITDGQLVVDLFEADSLYRERALLYSEDPANITLKQYHYHHWQEAPPRLLQQQLRDYLRAHGAAPIVTLRNLGNGPALHVRGRLERFEHIISDGRVIARVAMELGLSTDEKLLMSRDYTVDKPADSADVASVVSAIDAAVNDIFAKFLNDAHAARPAVVTAQ
jgi:cholesterol transport system auxiliary component